MPGVCETYPAQSENNSKVLKKGNAVINNLYVYIQAFSGALAGLTGQLTSLPTKSGSYTPVDQIANAWAQAVDSAWGDSTNPDSFEYEEIYLFSNDLFLVRNPQEPGSTSASSYTATAIGLMAILADSEAYFTSQGIVVPSFPTTQGLFFPVSTFGTSSTTDWTAAINAASAAATAA